MIKLLKLQKAVFVIAAGLLSFIAYKILDANEVKGSVYFQMLAGVLIMVGALWLLYPILFAKKADKDGKKVELKPVAKDPVEAEPESVASWARNSKPLGMGAS